MNITHKSKCKLLNPSSLIIRLLLAYSCFRTLERSLRRPKHEVYISLRGIGVDPNMVRNMFEAVDCIGVVFFFLPETSFLEKTTGEKK